MQYIRNYFSFIFMLLLLGAAFLIWNSIIVSGQDAIMEVSFLDVGQGDAIFIETPDGTQMLIDGGPNKKVLSELGDILPFSDRSIDVVMATHSDQDHIGGLIDVLERYDVGTIIESGFVGETGVYAEWVRARDGEDADIVFAKRGMRVQLDTHVFFDILWPQHVEGLKNPNDASIVGKLIYGDTCFIMTGDAERNSEMRLLYDDIDCEVLKVGHHGSKTSTSDAFVRAVSPAIAIISAGKENRYGHPHQIILNVLEKAGAEIFRTDIDKTIILHSNGSNVLLK
ncbi:MAG: ComEC/Rec2 family competence protein [bacterium]|nr:ComEC/Rec2 family competence protein [bacterium]